MPDELAEHVPCGVSFNFYNVFVSKQPHFISEETGFEEIRQQAPDHKLAAGKWQSWCTNPGWLNVCETLLCV